MPDAQKTEQELAREQIENVYKDGFAEINGRKYVFCKMTHVKRREVFAYFTEIESQLELGSLGFLRSKEFANIERIIHDSITFEDSLLSRIADQHWDKYPGDYVKFIITAFGVISFPFTSAGPTGSASR